MKYHVKDDRANNVPHYNASGYSSGYQHHGGYYSGGHQYEEKQQPQEHDEQQPYSRTSKDAWNSRQNKGQNATGGGRRRRDENENRSQQGNATGSGAGHYHHQSKQNVAASPNPPHRGERVDRSNDYRGGGSNTNDHHHEPLAKNQHHHHHHHQSNNVVGLAGGNSAMGSGNGGGGGATAGQNVAANAFTPGGLAAAASATPQPRQQFDLKQAAFPPLPTNNSQPQQTKASAPLNNKGNVAQPAAVSNEIPEVSVHTVASGVASNGVASPVASMQSSTVAAGGPVAAWGGDRLADVVKGTAGRLSVSKKTEKEARSVSQSPDLAAAAATTNSQPTTTTNTNSTTNSQSNELSQNNLGKKKLSFNLRFKLEMDFV